MQRPRNRQGRVPQQNERGHGRGRGGYRGGHTLSSTVPNTAQVKSGAFASIVLKIDQPTGREVQGIIAAVLTSGSHPRGIKVRLVDGRVGRVQRLVSEEVAKAESEGLGGLGRNGESGASTSSRFTHRYRDVREEDEMDLPPSGYSLGAFLPKSHLLQDTPAERTPAEKSEVRVCPVCEEFEGDAAAFSHHLATHFD